MRSSILKRILSQTPEKVSEKVKVYGQKRVSDYEYGMKLMKVIQSCKTIAQLINSYGYFKLFERRFAADPYVNPDWLAFTMRTARKIYEQKRKEFIEY